MSSLVFTARDGTTEVRPLFHDEEIQTVRFMLGSATIELNRSSRPDGSQTLDVLLRQNMETPARGAEQLRGTAQTPATTPSRDEHSGEHKKEVREALMVVFTLFASITFAAGLTPPGGFWSDDGENKPSGPFSSNVTYVNVTVANASVTGAFVVPISNNSLANNTVNGSTNNDNTSEKHHRAGDPIFPEKDERQYLAFTWFNSIAFVYSLASILYLLSEKASDRKETVRYLKCAVFLDLLFVLGAYISALTRSGFPLANQQGYKNVLAAISIIIVGVFASFFFIKPITQIMENLRNGIFWVATQLKKAFNKVMPCSLH